MGSRALIYSLILWFSLTSTEAATIPQKSSYALKEREANRIELQNTTEAVDFSPWPGMPTSVQLRQNPPLAMTYASIREIPKQAADRTEDLFNFIASFQKDLDDHYGWNASLILPRKVGSRVPDAETLSWWHIRFQTRWLTEPQLTALVRSASN